MQSVATPSYVEALFDRLSDVVFSIKARDGRYVCVSESCVRRCGLRRKQEAIGRTAFDLFPKPMAERYASQDKRVFRSGKPIVDNLDLTVYADGSTGWCLTTKEPIFDARGDVIGLACVSRDLTEPTRTKLIDTGFAGAIDYLLEHFHTAVRIDGLARRAGLTEAQFNLRMKTIFHLPATKYLTKLRVGHAIHLLADTGLSIADIALQSGFSDQSALSRQFRHLNGFTPSQYRRLAQSTEPR